MDNQFQNTTSNAPWIPEVVANEALGVLGNYLNLGNTVARDTDLTPVRNGQVISIPRRGVIQALRKVQNQTTQIQRPVADDVQVTVDQHWYVKIGEEDFTRAMQTDSTLPGYVEDAVIELAEKIEGNLLLHTDEFDNIDAGSSDNVISKLIDVRTQLIKNKAPKLQRKFGYVSPDFMGRMLKANAFLDPKVLQGANALVDGAVGRAEGFDIFEGQMVRRKGSPGWDQNFFYAKNALVLASRPLLAPGSELGVSSTTVQSEAGLAVRVVRYYDGDEMGVVVNVDTLFGSGVMDERLGFVLESAPTQS